MIGVLQRPKVWAISVGRHYGSTVLVILYQMPHISLDCIGLFSIQVEAERKHNTVIYHIRSTAEDDNQVTLLYCILSFAA